MGDKALLLLLIVFVVIGVFTYDQYITEKSGTSPLGQLMDASGMSQSARDRDLSLTTVSKFATFEEGSKFHLDRLLLKVKLIEEQRIKLLQDRNALLVELIELKDQGLQMAQKYQDAIEAEKREFDVYVTELQSISQLMADTYRINNFRVRDKNYQEIVRRISALKGDRDWGLVQPEITRLEEFIRNTVVQKNLTPVNNCQTPEQCLQENVQRSHDFLKEILIDFEQAYKPRLVNAVRITQKARKNFSDQIQLLELSQDFVARQNNYFQKKFGELLSQLNAITPNDPNSMIQAYQEIEIEHRAMSDKVQQTNANFVRYFESEKEQMAKLLESLEPAKKEAYSDFFDVVLKNQQMEEQYFQRLVELDNQIVQILGHRAFENKLFMKNVAALLEIDINLLVGDQRYANRLNANYMRFRADLEERRRTVGIKNIHKSQPVVRRKPKPPTPAPAAPPANAPASVNPTPSQPIQQPQAIQQPNVSPPQPVQQQQSNIRQPQPIRKVNNQVRQPNVRHNFNQSKLRQQQQRQRNTMSQFNNARNRARDQGF